MKRILFVEDDEVVARIYEQKLRDTGFEVFLAADGMEAVGQLPEVRPDLVVLDILLPKLGGVDVLRFIRQNPQLKATPVVVLSNAFLNEAGQQLVALGVEEMLLKSAVTPAQLVESIRKIFARAEAPADPLFSAETPRPTESKTEFISRRESAAEFSQRIRRDFYDQIPVISETLNTSLKNFLSATDPFDRSSKLALLMRKVGFLTHMTGMAGCHRIAQLSSVLEALLMELQEKASNINESTLQTTSATIALLIDCLARADQADEQCLSPTTILVVDDDAVSNRALFLALSRYRLNATFVLDPFVALQRLRQNSYDIVLLDINLPGMDGINMCEQMRDLPRHQHTPVIFITSYLEFEPRARSILRGGDDLITKPILPIELTVKVIANSLKRRMMLSNQRS